LLLVHAIGHRAPKLPSLAHGLAAASSCSSQILVTKSFLYSIPGICLGLLLAFLINIPIAQLIAGYAHIDPTYRSAFLPHWLDAVVLAAVVLCALVFLSLAWPSLACDLPHMGPLAMPFV
jgi:ABC-type antimicrobial peptide transport system permease subunit